MKDELGLVFVVPSNKVHAVLLHDRDPSEALEFPELFSSHVQPLCDVVDRDVYWHGPSARFLARRLPRQNSNQTYVFVHIQTAPVLKAAIFAVRQTAPADLGTEPIASERARLYAA